jgi:hypothetical protein
MDKEEFHWLFGVVQGWFSAKLGSKISYISQLSAVSCQHNFLKWRIRNAIHTVGTNALGMTLRTRSCNSVNVVDRFDGV